MTVDDIKSFEARYKGSEEEAEDLKKAYLQHEGDMDHIMSEVLCSAAEDEPRYAELLRDWVGEGVLPDFPGFSKESEKKKRKRNKMYEREASEAKRMRVEDGESSECCFVDETTPSSA